MKTVLTAAAAFALAAALSTPVLAQQASEQAAANEHAYGQCGFSQAMLTAKANGEQERMAETKSKIDALVENALASSRAAKVAQSTVKQSNESPDS